jgi:sugar transferase (PEP-CTERM system associated)
MLRIYNHYISKTVLLLVSTEVFVLMTTFYTGTFLRYPEDDELSVSYETFAHFFPEAGTFTLIMILSMAAIGMYHLESRPDIKGILIRLMPSMVLSFGLMTLIFYLLPDLHFGRGMLGVAMFLALPTLLITRCILLMWLNLDILESRAIVLGTGTKAQECVELCKINPKQKSLKIVCFIPLPGEERCVEPSNIQMRQESESLMALAKRFNANEIIVAIQNRRGSNFPIQELLECKLHGIKITDEADFFEREKGHLRVTSLYPSWLIFGDGFDQSSLRSAIKRSFDLIASVILFTVTLPIMLIAAICIFIESGAPIIYRQERVGRGGETFMVLKFRSMRNDAEKKGKPQWAETNDPRITRVGSIIRKLRIDELPQIVNVLKGEMSFVGPRPERPYFVEQLCAEVPYYNARHSIKPGITGWAQVRYRYGSSVKDAIEKLQYDLYYVKNHSLFLDIIIIIDTIEVVVLSKGGR